MENNNLNHYLEKKERMIQPSPLHQCYTSYNDIKLKRAHFYINIYDDECEIHNNKFKMLKDETAELYVSEIKEIYEDELEIYSNIKTIADLLEIINDRIKFKFYSNDKLYKITLHNSGYKNIYSQLVNYKYDTALNFLKKSITEYINSSLFFKT